MDYWRDETVALSLGTPPEPLAGTLTVAGYPATLDGEEGAYGIVVDGLPGCVAMGATREEAMEAGHEAVADWLATTHTQGRP